MNNDNYRAVRGESGYKPIRNANSSLIIIRETFGFAVCSVALILRIIIFRLDACARIATQTGVNIL